MASLGKACINERFKYLLTYLVSMKTLNITFTTKEFQELKRFKTTQPSWHDFIMLKARKHNKVKGGAKNGNNNNK